MLKDEFTGNPRLGQNVIDKVRSMIFVPVLAFKKCFEVCFVMFQVNNYMSQGTISILQNLQYVQIVGKNSYPRD